MKELGILAGLGLVGAAAYVYFKNRPPSGQAITPGNFSSAGTGGPPTRFGFGGPYSVPQVQPVNAPPSYAALGTAGINAIAKLASIYIDRSRTTLPPTAPGRATTTTATPVPGGGFGSTGQVIPTSTDTAPDQPFQTSVEQYDTEKGVATGNNGSPYDYGD